MGFSLVEGQGLPLQSDELTDGRRQQETDETDEECSRKADGEGLSADPP
jgi:hypothetical protein